MANTYWDIEIPIIVRTLINDMDNNPTYSDDRIKQLIVVSANYVIQDAILSTSYSIDTVAETISPDPASPSSRDGVFIGLLALKSACFLDQSTFRTKAMHEGISAALGPARLSVGGSLQGYKTLLEMGPCSMYEKLIMNNNIGDINNVRAILSPFVGNNFDPRYLTGNTLRGRDFY
jgi:hypothetical protein